jgi:hypothetical protein
LDLDEGGRGSLLCEILPPLKRGCGGGLGSDQLCFAGVEGSDLLLKVERSSLVLFTGQSEVDAELFHCCGGCFIGGGRLGHVVVLEECCFTSDASTRLGLSLDGLSA